MRPPGAAELRHQAVVAFAHALVVAALNRELHAADSDHVARALAELVGALRRAAALGVDMPLHVQCSDDRLHHDGEALDGPSLQAGSLLRCCSERQVAMLAFGPALDAEEANRLLDLLLLPANVDALSRENREAALAAFGIRNVRVTLRSPGDPGDRRAAVGRADQALHRYQDLARCLQQNHARAQRDQELGIAAAAHTIERTVVDCDEPSLLLSLATQDDVDRFTVGHSVRVALLALQVARGLGASREQQVQVGAAALLHDIGKSKVPQEILFKQGRLSADEWYWMSQHPRLGAQILIEQHEKVDARAIGAAFCHHMAPSGKGYPDPLLPVAPSGTSRLVRVCDVFEALTSVRPYKRALTPIEAYAVMFRNEGDFDPAWLRRFVRTIGLFPTGTRVRLANGAAAVVREQGASAERPVVQLLSGAGDQPLAAGEPDLFSIGDEVEGTRLRVAAIETHERGVDVPDFDAGPPAAQACLPAVLAAGTVRPPNAS